MAIVLEEVAEIALKTGNDCAVIDYTLVCGDSMFQSLYRQICRTVGLLKPGWMNRHLHPLPWRLRRTSFFRVRVRRDSKVVRFSDHLPKIRNNHIYLPEFAIWREALVAEIVAFNGEFDDQIDAMNLDLDFIDTDLTIPRSGKREPLSVVNASPVGRRLIR
jgi:hypothetical protein